MESLQPLYSINEVLHLSAPLQRCRTGRLMRFYILVEILNTGSPSVRRANAMQNGQAHAFLPPCRASESLLSLDKM